MTTRTTVTATVTLPDSTVQYRTFSWNGRAVKRHTDNIRAKLKGEGARSVSFGMAIPVHSYGAH